MRNRPAVDESNRYFVLELHHIVQLGVGLKNRLCEMFVVSYFCCAVYRTCEGRVNEVHFGVAH